jgi:hypothetical protein
MAAPDRPPLETRVWDDYKCYCNSGRLVRRFELDQLYDLLLDEYPEERRCSIWKFLCKYITQGYPAYLGPVRLLTSHSLGDAIADVSLLGFCMLLTLLKYH